MPVREHYPIINETAFQITLAHLALRRHPAPVNDNECTSWDRPVGPYVGTDPPNHSN